MIYVARNPKDVIVSFYYHHLLIPNIEMNADLSTFARFFINDKGNIFKIKFSFFYYWNFDSSFRTFLAAHLGSLEAAQPSKHVVPLLRRYEKGPTVAD